MQAGVITILYSTSSPMYLSTENTIRNVYCKIIILAVFLSDWMIKSYTETTSLMATIDTENVFLFGVNRTQYI